jgi:hypothetical protein
LFHNKYFYAQSEITTKIDAEAVASTDLVDEAFADTDRGA